MFPGNPMFPGFVTLWSFLSLTAVVIVVMLIIKAVNYSQKLRADVAVAMIQKGVYDPRFFEPQLGSAATLGWGIALIAAGAAIITGLLILGKTGGLIGGLIPLFLGSGLVITYALVRRSSAKAVWGGAPPALFREPRDTGSAGAAPVHPEDVVQKKD